MDRMPRSTKLVLTQKLDEEQRRIAQKTYLKIMLRRKHIRRQNTLVRSLCTVLLLGIASTGIIISNPAQGTLPRLHLHYTSKSVTLRWE